MKLYKIGVIVGCLLLAGGSIKAQSVEDKALQELRADSSARTRFITRATMYGVGFTNVFDTYLSPQEYKGVDFRISRESMRMTKWMNGNVSFSLGSCFLRPLTCYNIISFLILGRKI